MAKVPGLSGAEHDRRAEQSTGPLDRLETHTHTQEGNENELFVMISLIIAYFTLFFMDIKRILCVSKLIHVFYPSLFLPGAFRA